MIAPFGIVGNAQETTTEVAVMLEKVGADGFEGAIIKLANSYSRTQGFLPASNVLRTTATLGLLEPTAVLAWIVNEYAVDGNNPSKSADVTDVLLIVCTTAAGDVIFKKYPVSIPLLFSNEGTVQETRTDVDVIVVPISDGSWLGAMYLNI